jgi:hypothetical protein
MKRDAQILVSLFAVWALAAALALVLPFRQSGALATLHRVLAVVSVAAGVTWPVLTILALPRAARDLATGLRAGQEISTLTPAIVLLAFAAVLLTALLLVAWAAPRWCAIRMPGQSHQGALPPLTVPQQSLRDALRRDVRELAGNIGDRNALNQYPNLCIAAEYVRQSLARAGYRVYLRDCSPDMPALRGRECHNLETQILGARQPDEIVVIGAHYDTVVGTPGANDNASGVAALLALARSMTHRHSGRTVRFVAFANEEPPFFWSRNMGSAVYARHCRARGERIVAMLSLETIGYYTDAPDSQRYPTKLLGWFYPTTGNFVGFIGNTASRRLVWDAVDSFRRHTQFPSEGAALPGLMGGVGWSDHWAFWQAGYPAIMVTDTAPFRYAWYHAAQDTPDKLDYDRLARVVSGLDDVVADLVR